MTRPFNQAAADAEIDRAPLVNGFTFWDALLLAWGTLEPTGEGADAGPLADYIAVRGHRLSRLEAGALADWARRAPTREVRGTRGAAKHRLPLYEAERQEALRVKAEKAAWLIQHPTTSKGTPRREVPQEVTKQMIRPGFEFKRIDRLTRDKRRRGST